MTITIPDIGKVYEFLWPIPNPQMRMIGEVVSIESGQFTRAMVNYASDKPPHEIILEGKVRWREVNADIRRCWQIKAKVRRTTG